MTFRRRVKLSEQKRNDMWRRWKAGQSLQEIGRVFGKDHVSIQFMLAQHGGIVPAVRPDGSFAFFGPSGYGNAQENRSR